MRNFWKLFLIPVIFYFCAFTVLTYPAILSFPRVLFADTGDGLQNVWNIWWVNKAVTQLHQTVWKTDYLHYPYGVSLIGHTLNPLNGIIAIPLLKFFSLTTAYNIVLTFAFVFAGVTGFWLAFYLSKGYWPSLVAGYIYTFSQFHFAHAQGHLQTVSIQWMPLFLLSWLVFLQKQNVLLALFSAVMLYFNLLSDYYLFLYSVSAAAILYFSRGIKAKNLPAVFIFIIASAVTCGKIIAALILQNIRDPLLGSHPAGMFSTDLLSVIIPGGHWRFAHFTSGFWSKLPGNIHESSVSLGISVAVMLIYVLRRREKIKDKTISAWFVIFSLFLIFSFGPNLQVAGTSFKGILMPYGFAEKFIPLVSLSGMPVRMMAMVTLSGAVICAYGLKYLTAGSVRKKIMAFIFLAVLFVEYLPIPLPQTEITPPPFVRKLQTLPPAGVLDAVSSPTEALYYQTIHEKPLAFGYLARIPQSVALDDMAVDLLLRGQSFDRLCHAYGFRYLIADAAFGSPSGMRVIYSDSKVKLLEFGGDPPCRYR